MAPEQPKKVTGGAFGRYMAEHRQALIKECAGKPVTASVKLGSERYKALSATEQGKYQKQYEEAQHTYVKAMAAFLAAGGEVAARKSKSDKKEKKVKDPNRPKKPAGGAYGCYLNKHRQSMMKECAGKPITAVSKLAGERWKALSAEEKKPFEAEYLTKKAAYEKAMKSYVPPAGAADAADGSEDGNDEEEEDDKDEEAEEAEEPPAKKAKAGAKAAAAPKAKAGGKANDATVDAEAKKLGYAVKLKTLSENSQIKASPSNILDALKKTQRLSCRREEGPVRCLGA